MKEQRVLKTSGQSFDPDTKSSDLNTFAMGSIFSSKSGHEMNVPQTLEELLQSFENSQVTDPDKAISGDSWTAKFRVFLRKRDLSDEETALKFLVMTQNFANHSQDESVSPETFQDTFLRCGEMFFSSESETQLALSNTVLFNAISTKVTEMKSDPTIVLTPDDVILLNNARTDMNIWQNGLRPKFMKFIKTQKPSAMACLLSIL